MQKRTTKEFDKNLS